jgi:hypothetical protein
MLNKVMISLYIVYYSIHIHSIYIHVIDIFVTLLAQFVSMYLFQPHQEILPHHHQIQIQ